MRVPNLNCILQELNKSVLGFYSCQNVEKTDCRANPVTSVTHAVTAHIQKTCSKVALLQVFWICAENVKSNEIKIPKNLQVLTNSCKISSIKSKLRGWSLLTSFMWYQHSLAFECHEIQSCNEKSFEISCCVSALKYCTKCVAIYIVILVCALCQPILQSFLVHELC